MTRFKDRLPTVRHAAIAAGLLLVGGAIGAGATLAAHPSEAMAPGAPVRIAALADAARPWIGEPVVTVQGRVAETYGGSVVIVDDSGRALVDLGRGGADSSALAANQLVTVQGSYDNGVIRARYLVGPDGRVAMLGGGHGHRGRHRGGPDGRGFDRPEPDAAPAAPAPAAPAGNAVAPAT